IDNNRTLLILLSWLQTSSPHPLLETSYWLIAASSRIHPCRDAVRVAPPTSRRSQGRGRSLRAFGTVSRLESCLPPSVSRTPCATASLRCPLFSTTLDTSFNDPLGKLSCEVARHAARLTILRTTKAASSGLHLEYHLGGSSAKATLAART
ncbi:hypothetical protein PMAYCL1PPCAC_09819, partial [Pristionchus mayeri]